MKQIQEISDAVISDYVETSSICQLEQDVDETKILEEIPKNF